MECHLAGLARPFPPYPGPGVDPEGRLEALIQLDRPFNRRRNRTATPTVGADPNFFSAGASQQVVNRGI